MHNFLFFCALFFLFFPAKFPKNRKKVFFTDGKKFSPEEKIEKYLTSEKIKKYSIGQLFYFFYLTKQKICCPFRMPRLPEVILVAWGVIMILVYIFLIENLK